VAALKTTRARRVATAFIAGCSLWACYLWGLAPFSLQAFPYVSTSSPQVQDANKVIRALPPNAVVSAYYPYVSHIDHRTRIYMWPNPFRAQYWNTFHEEGRELPFANQIQYVLLPTDLGTSDYGEVFNSIASQFHVVAQAGDVALYRRN
jgi:hypothetical protein